MRFDSVIGSGFVAVYKEGISSRLKTIWEIPEDEKKEFAKLIEELEEKQINGVEFECEGEWITNGLELRVKSLPRLTEKGKKRIRESGGKLSGAARKQAAVPSVSPLPTRGATPTSGLAIQC
jgi:hypothetical protein